MFKVGEKVVYPAHGVGEVEAVRTQVISGTERRFYMLRILDTDMKIMVPVDNAMAVGLRKIIDKTTVSRVYRILREKNPKQRRPCTIRLVSKYVANANATIQTMVKTRGSWFSF